MRRVLSLLARVRSEMVKTLCVSVGIRGVRASFSGSRSVAERRVIVAGIRGFIKSALGGVISRWRPAVIRVVSAGFSCWGSAVGRVVASCE